MKAQERDQLLQSLKNRFAKNLHRHPGHAWEKVQAKLDGNAAALKSLQEMESSGGEPDVIGYDEANKQYIFCDCAAESLNRPGFGRHLGA